jgi:hypothetical protein
MQNLSEIVKLETRQLVQLALTSQNIQSQIQIDLSGSKTMIASIQLGQIFCMPAVENLPASGECLRFCQSMVERRRSENPTSTPQHISAFKVGQSIRDLHY